MSGRFNNFTKILSQIQKAYPLLSKRIKEAGAVSRWDKAVGPIIAKHARALRVQDGVLWVECDHPIWRSELHHRKRQILDILNEGIEAADKDEEKPLIDMLFVDPRKPRT